MGTARAHTGRQSPGRLRSVGSRRATPNPQLASSAHYAVARAIETGSLIRPTACQKCLAPGFVVAHHEDYGQPLNVEWLCPSCHTERHRPGCRRLVVWGEGLIYVESVIDRTSRRKEGHARKERDTARA